MGSMHATILQNYFTQSNKKIFHLCLLVCVDYSSYNLFLILLFQTHTNASVLIMELCTEGSLLDLLQKPENIYGLKDGDVVAVIKDVCMYMAVIFPVNS